MEFLFILALLASSSLNYIIHFSKMALPSKVQLIDGVESTVMYVDAGNIIHRMGVTAKNLHEIYPIQCSFDVERLELKNRRA